MSVDHAALALAMQEAIPLLGHLQIKVTELAPGHGVALLPDVDAQRNHLGSQHAGALFTAGETASGAVLVATLGERLADVVPLAEGAEIAYGRVAHGPITATAALDGEAEAVLAGLEQDGRARFAVDVVLHDEREQEVATMRVRWHVRTRAAEASA